MSKTIQFQSLAHNTINVGDRVEAGDDRDRDTGVVHSVDGDTATVGWDSGVRTTCPLAELRLTTERHSGGRRMAERGLVS